MDTIDKAVPLIWIISTGAPVNLNLTTILKEPLHGPVTAYKISELAHYLTNPHSITLEEKVIGCKVQYRKPHYGRIHRFVRALFSRSETDSRSDSEEILSRSKIETPAFKDPHLNSHFMKINDFLKPYDHVHKKLSQLNIDTVDTIHAICEDIGKNRYQLNLQGSISDKIQFVLNSLSKKVRVSFNRVYLMNGLFEMRGFNFSAFDMNKFYLLLKISEKKRSRYCVLDADYRFLYWIEDNLIINYLHLLEESIKKDHHLRDAFRQCMSGDAQPLKLFFSTHRENSYSEKFLPRVYRDVLSVCNVAPGEIQRITKVLNDFQSIISFNYVPKSGSGKLYTTVSVMHDVKALDPIRTSLPDVYSHIQKKASLSDAGRLYLLDSLKGYQNV